MAFDLNYFTPCTGEKLESKLRRYPKEIREAFYKRSKNQGLPNWFVLDNNRTIVLKIRSSREEKWSRPLVLQALEDNKKAINSLLDMTVKMIKKQKETEKEALKESLDSYKKKIDLMKQSLDVQKDEYHYQKELSDKKSAAEK